MRLSYNSEIHLKLCQIIDSQKKDEKNNEKNEKS